MQNMTREEAAHDESDFDENVTIKIDNDLKMHSSFVNLTTPKNVFLFSSSNHVIAEQKEHIASVSENSFGAETVTKNNIAYSNLEPKTKGKIFT